ncbi:MAG TPA: alpha/beta hydrolase [Bacteriovoracaceae bacterium]|nr:alpha/beta hydrolase [Bacteriovoracaceae bacterium]
MIKLTNFPSIKETDQNLILIPGGPGLSSQSLKHLEILKDSFNLYFVDFPGTNGNPYLGKKSFEELSDLLIDNLKEISGKIFVLGHSYGGFFAADYAIQNGCDGIICLATPFSKNSLAGASANYESKKTVEIIEASVEWQKNPSDKTFKNWLASYGELYFSSQKIEAGRELMLNDFSSAQFFIDNRTDSSRLESLLPALNLFTGKKLFIAGENDGLLNREDLIEDARKGSFDFVTAENTNHFMMLDQPEIVAGLIKNYLRL